MQNKESADSVSIDLTKAVKDVFVEKQKQRVVKEHEPEQIYLRNLEARDFFQRSRIDKLMLDAREAVAHSYQSASLVEGWKYHVSPENDYRGSDISPSNMTSVDFMIYKDKVMRSREVINKNAATPNLLKSGGSMHFVNSLAWFEEPTLQGVSPFREEGNDKIFFNNLEGEGYIISSVSGYDRYKDQYEITLSGTSEVKYKGDECGDIEKLTEGLLQVIKSPRHIKKFDQSKIPKKDYLPIQWGYGRPHIPYSWEGSFHGR